MIPHTLVTPGLVIHSIYNGYWFWGRPSVDELGDAGWGEVPTVRTPKRTCSTTSAGLQLVGERGFEPPTSCTQSRCATTAPLPGAPSLTIRNGDTGGGKLNRAEAMKPRPCQ